MQFSASSQPVIGQQAHQAPRQAGARLCERALAVAHGLVPGRHDKQQAQVPRAQVLQCVPACPFTASHDYWLAGPAAGKSLQTRGSALQQMPLFIELSDAGTGAQRSASLAHWHNLRLSIPYLILLPDAKQLGAFPKTGCGHVQAGRARPRARRMSSSARSLSHYQFRCFSPVAVACAQGWPSCA